MSRLLLVLITAALVLGRPSPSRALDPGEEFGLALSAAGADLFYTPAKVTVAFVGLVFGSLTGILTGGDARAAYAIWVPAAGGTYVLRPSHLEGTLPIEFFGSDYADRSSGGATEAGGIYEAQYSK